jgi:hypothetical protein
MARIINANNTIPITVDDAKHLRPGDVIYYLAKEKTFAMKVSALPTVPNEKPDAVKILWQVGKWMNGYITERDLATNLYVRRAS